MSRTWYRRLLLSYFPIFLITVTILIFIAFLFVNEISRAETKKADRITNNYLVESLQRTLKEIEMGVLKEVESNPGYKEYFNREVGDTASMYAVAASLRKLSDNPDFIKSIYLYRQKDQSILTQNGLNDLQTFADKAWVEKVLSEQQEQGWMPVREYKDMFDKTPVRVISMYKRMPLPFGSQGILFINVKLSGIERIVDEMVDGQISFVEIRDRQGNTIYNAHAKGEGRGKGKVLNMIHSETLDWTFVSGIKDGNLFGWVSVISYIWVILGLITVTGAVVYIIYITRRNYKPIQVMMNRIESLQIRNAESGFIRDEMKLIETTLENLINHTLDYEKQHKENLLLQRSRLFMDILQGERMDGILQRMEELGPLSGIPEKAEFSVVIAEINRYDAVFQNTYSKRDQNTLKFALMNVYQDLARNAELQGWAEWVTTNRAAIIFLATASDAEMREKMRIVADDCRQWVEKHLRISLSFGIGSMADGPEEIRDSYRAAEAALQHKLLMGESIIMTGGESARTDLIETYKYMQMIADFVREFRMSSGNWRLRLEEIFDSFQSDFMKDDDIRSLIQALLQMLGREVAVMSEELQREFAGEKAAKRQQALKEAESIGELKALLFGDLTDVFRTYVSVSETKSYRALVCEMKQYIEENFTNPDLSLKHLSDRFQISGKYASYLFKTEFDMKFVDFLMELRMKEAEKLLLATEDPLQEIARKVGYANSITFGRVFKRIVGMTPGDYRRVKRFTLTRE